MNTGKQIQAMVLLLFLLVIASGAYVLFEETRAENAETDQLEITADRGAETYALNCRLCHGDRGEGGLLGGRLPGAPPLDTDEFRGVVDGVYSIENLEAAFALATNTITCGRVGTFMPTWGQSQGGTLNQEQIRQLAVLITGANPVTEERDPEGFWELAVEHADEIDAETTLHAEVNEPDGVFNADEEELEVTNASAFTTGQYIRIGGFHVVVQRGAAGTEADSHGAGTAVRRAVPETDEAANGEGENGSEEREALSSLTEGVGPEDTKLFLHRNALIEVGDELTLGDETVTVRAIGEEERLRINTLRLEVERGVNGSEAAEHETGTPLVTSDTVGEEQPETGDTLVEAIDAEQTELPVSGTRRVRPGVTLTLDDEKVRVLGILTGIPTTGQELIRDVGREPRELLVSGSETIEVGATIRVDSESMVVDAIRDDGDAGLELDGELSSSATRISVSDADFFQPDYVVRVGNERIRVIGQVDTGQLLGEQIGRAETTFAVSGTVGLSEGMVIRMGQELMEITEVEPARVNVERAVPDSEGNPSQAASHGAGTAVLETGVAEEEEDTGQSLLEQVDADSTTVVVTGSSGINEGDVYQLDGELVEVVEDGVESASLRVRRAVGGSSLQAHSSRVPIFEGNLLDVERGAENTSAASHDDAETIFFTELEVEREVEGTKVEDHSKGAEVFLGQRLLVERGVLETEATDHANGQLVRDFPPAPEPETNPGGACGTRTRPEVVESPEPTVDPGAPTPTPPLDGAVSVEVALVDPFAVDAVPPSATAGVITFDVTNVGVQLHNFRAIATDVPADELPISEGIVDLQAPGLEVVAETTDLDPGAAEAVQAELPAGNYVLICNIIGHYVSGMFTEFEVTEP